MTPPTAAEYQEIGAWVQNWRRPLLLSHARPDGDALGSLIALQAALQSQGAEPCTLIYEPLPERYALIGELGPLHIWQQEVTEADLEEADGIILLDTCTHSQLTPIADWLRAARQPKLAVDHHVTRDPIPERYLVDESAAATCQILYDWFQAVGWPIDDACRDALVVGIATDTGWFRHGNTDARTFETMAELTRRGANSSDLFHLLYYNDPASRLRLRTAGLASLELLLDDRLALMCVTPGTMRRVGALPSDTEELVNEPLRVGSVCVSVLLVSEVERLVRVSFRSKQPLAAGAPDVDVSRAAEQFGGGGHKRAAGARVEGSIVQVRRALLDYFETVLPVEDD